ncbi:uncharacterized protein LOC144658395 [Oculina patagonica]
MKWRRYQYYFQVILRLAVCAVWMCGEHTMAQQDACRVLKFTEPIEESSLTGHVFKTLTLEIKENCELKCYLENDCFSYNLGPLVDGKYVCELSDSDDGQHPQDLVPRHGFLYVATKNSCSKSACSANGKCQNGFTDYGYRCECQPGFVGQRCEIGFHLGTWLKINTNPICFGARDDAYGSFTVAKAGSISALKLVHVSGVLVCHQQSTTSYWGCERVLYGDKTLMTVITYDNRTMFLPTRHTARMGAPGQNCASGYSYHLDGFDDRSPELVFKMSQSGAMSVAVNQEFQIWYGQDIENCSEMNNSGQSCVHVYFWYNTIY